MGSSCTREVSIPTYPLQVYADDASPYLEDEARLMNDIAICMKSYERFEINSRNWSLHVPGPCARSIYTAINVNSIR